MKRFVNVLVAATLVMSPSAFGATEAEDTQLQAAIEDIREVWLTRGLRRVQISMGITLASLGGLVWSGQKIAKQLKTADVVSFEQFMKEAPSTMVFAGLALAGIWAAVGDAGVKKYFHFIRGTGQPATRLTTDSRIKRDQYFNEYARELAQFLRQPFEVQFKMASENSELREFLIQLADWVRCWDQTELVDPPPFKYQRYVPVTF